jgi:hypothetical protein
MLSHVMHAVALTPPCLIRQWVFDSIAGMRLEDERKYSPAGTAPAARASGLEAASTEPGDDEHDTEDDAFDQA